MTATTTQTLVAELPDGTTFEYRTRAEYDWAGFVLRGRTYELAAKGWSQESVRSRTRTRAGTTLQFVVVPLRVKVPGLTGGEVPPEIAAHFEHKRECAGSPRREVPMIVEIFTAGEGWTKVSPLMATFTNIRTLPKTVLTVACQAYGSPVADFPVEPMLRRASLPLLGGAVIGSKTKVRG